MPTLKDGEVMHTCESPYCSVTTGGSRKGKQRPYIVRKYFTGIERQWCSTCLSLGKKFGFLEYKYTDKGDWDGTKLIDGFDTPKTMEDVMRIVE